MKTPQNALLIADNLYDLCIALCQGLLFLNTNDPCSKHTDDNLTIYRQTHGNAVEYDIRPEPRPTFRPPLKNPKSATALNGLLG